MSKAPAKLTRFLRFRAWPKMIFLWPTAVVSLAMGLATHMSPESYHEYWGGLFMVVFGLNLLVLTFEFPRATSLTLAVVVVAIVLGLFLLNQFLDIIPALGDLIESLQISASHDFYYTFFVIQIILFIGMYVQTRFDYWELSPNELIHHRGMLGDIERFSTAGLKLNCELNDVFEFLLAGAGRVVLQIPANPRPIVLENVLNISRVTRAADEILEARSVRLDAGGSQGVPIAVRAEEEN